MENERKMNMLKQDGEGTWGDERTGYFDELQSVH